MVSSIPRKQGSNRLCLRVFLPGLPTHLVQELNASTVIFKKNLPIKYFHKDTFSFIPIRV